MEARASRSFMTMLSLPLEDGRPRPACSCMNTAPTRSSLRKRTRPLANDSRNGEGTLLQGSRLPRVDSRTSPAAKGRLASAHLIPKPLRGCAPASAAVPFWILPR